MKMWTLLLKYEAASRECGRVSSITLYVGPCALFWAVLSLGHKSSHIYHCIFESDFLLHNKLTLLSMADSFLN